MRVNEKTKHKCAEREKALQTQALSYLKEKYPEVNERTFFTDSAGEVSESIIEFSAVARAAEIEEICGKCEGGVCGISEAMKAKHSRPIVNVSKSPRGYMYLDVRWTSGFSCKYEKLSEEFERMYKTSGLSATREGMTFEKYQSADCASETWLAKLEAVRVSEAGTNLILAGKAGTGKTHLAVAIAIYVMKHGRQAIFRLVSTMLDEIQSAIRDNGDYDGLMRQFKTVPCLVLDDLGHENMTSARASYLHQIIDYRYVHELQTIVTTNAKNIAELCNWNKEEYMLPMVSRILERGKWLTMENTEDYRQKRSVDNDR